MAAVCLERGPRSSGSPRRRESQVDAAAQPTAGCAAELTATIAAAEQRILRPKSCGEAEAALARSPSRSLLEASARRLAQSENKGAAADAEDAGDVPMRFIQLYMAAIRDANAKWTSDSQVSELFDDGATMVTQDKQTFHGKQAVLRRLDKGVETLVKMAGKDAELPTYELVGPTPTVAGTRQLECTIKRGRNTFKFRLDFTLSKGRIVALRNSRV